MRIDEALIGELNRQGVRHVFGLMGEDISRLMVLLPKSGISYLSSRHESGAVGMADGYSRVSGDIGVAMVSRGPGLTNALTATTTASRGGSRVLVIAADTSDSLPRADSIAGTARSSHKFIDQDAVVAAVGVHRAALHDPATAVADLSAVIERVRRGETWVVSIPVSTLNATVADGDVRSESDLMLPPASGPQTPDPAQIGQVADLLETTWAASYPVIVAGRGAVRAGAAEILRELAELTGSLTSTTLPALSMFRGDPYNVGIMGTFSSPLASELFARADVLLSFGASLNRLTTYGNSLTPKALIVQFDSDPSAFGRFVDTELVVCGDVGLAAAALTEELRKRGHRHDGYRTEATAKKIAGWDPMTEIRDQSDSEGIDPRLLVMALDEILPADRVLVVDPGHHMAFQLSHFDMQNPESVLLPLDFGAIGSATPMAIGAAIATPERQVVLGAGDGGFMMTLGEMDTAIRARVPLLMLVLDDAAYGAEVHVLDWEGESTELARFEERSFEAMASAMGADAMTIRTLDDVKPLRDRLREGLLGPLLVHCRITSAVRAEFMSNLGLVLGLPAHVTEQEGDGQCP